ncbi:PRC-barrel domain-containing protein [Stieleria sp. TO1_6]|uniref:PRC-barrel domain-containing protein n=1 Tax=Stieleria tagensis TaxID=2956795 RepID=UPI00209AA81D|nr:PRC-barrel domain-containing protein [Stieleria tagensis]MCO8121433.1 PRC-barrel domain-containing protein [Stieleria tagensis]
MKSFFHYSLALVALACLTVTPLTAQDAAQKERLKRQRPVNPTDPSAAARMDARTPGAAVRASQLIGMNIQNAQGKSVGEINDIVFDTSTGKVRYAAVTYGGFLGVGDKLFAVPFEAFKYQRDADDQDEYVMVLNVTQQQLEGDAGFDDDNWPNFADRSFTSQLDKRYGVERRNMRQRLRDGSGRVDVDVDRDGVDVDVDSDRE